MKTIQLITLTIILFCFCINANAQKKRLLSKNGTSEWIKLPVGSGWDHKNFRYHDFDGDGITDIFTVKNGQFIYSKSAAASWVTLNSKYITRTKKLTSKELRFADFNKDGKTDVFFIWKGYFGYCSGGKGEFIRLKEADKPIALIHLGDFNGDGKIDMLSIN